MNSRILTASLILGTASAVLMCCTSKGSKAARDEDLSTWRDSTAWPRTVNAAVDTLLAGLSSDERKKFTAIPEDSLWATHFSLGLDIRNQFGLWRGNVALLESCGQRPPYVPDNCSGLIIRRAWEKLHQKGAA
jgi:uncharacterized protein DUF6794